jgi:hypothetical protein
MKVTNAISVLILSTFFFAIPTTAQENPLGFFLTSNGPGNGADLGGLAGADAHCEMLAEKVEAGDREWRAYLSTQGSNAVNARDRIGSGPWYNANGRLVGRDVNELHSYGTRVSMREAVAENGAIIPGGGYAPNRHDILTGSQPDGTAYPAGDDMTCNNWTSSGAGTARVGHHDRAAWNSAHPSRGPDGGCSQNDLRSTGGDGLFYCFATD